ncbi:MAG: ABC transporter permease [Nocardiopsaceae bacterium]|nr:ABC transporter permease [Nocardiopsaceae bacterium]
MLEDKDSAALDLEGLAPVHRTGSRGGIVARRVEAWALVVLWGALIVAFAFAEPGVFLTVGNWANILGNQAVLLLLALASLVPLVMRDFDLSLGAITTLSAMTLAILNVSHHMPIALACVIAIAASLCVSALNALFTVKLGGNPFVITLGMLTVVTGIVFLISGSATVGVVSPSLVQLVFLDSFLGIPVEFYIGLLVAIVVWYVLSMTPAGQQAVVVGESREVARLSGVRVARCRTLGYLAAGFIAGLGGIVWAASTGSVDPTTGGTELLLPAVAAVFLGSTCITPGRFNAPGTVIAVYFLASGAVGLEIKGAQDYVQQLFYGAALIVAVIVPKLLGPDRGASFKLM